MTHRDHLELHVKEPTCTVDFGPGRLNAHFYASIILVSQAPREGREGACALSHTLILYRFPDKTR